MNFLLKLLCLILLNNRVEPKSNSSDKECTKKFPDCKRDGKMYTNTACERQNCDPKFKECIELPPDAEFRQAMLDKHNELRNKIASGQDTTGGNSAAANMRALSYDLGLEYTSICHVHGCRMVHDKCRGTKLFPEAGQNLAMLTRTEHEPITQEIVDQFSTLDTFKELVDGWYDEIKLDDFTNKIDPFDFKHETGHFTALIWATTTHMGCARAIDRTKEKEFDVHLTCNYSPDGNIIGASMYKKGEGCSQCPSGIKCNSKYKALCGEDNNQAVHAGENPYRSCGQSVSLSNTIILNTSVLIFVLGVKINMYNYFFFITDTNSRKE